MTASVSSHNMAVHPYRRKIASGRMPLSQRLNTIHETGDLYATVPKAKKQFSPPNLPPCWGQDVAPPPTPLFTPQTSPGNSNGKHIDPSNENEGHDIEIVDVPLTYGAPSEVMEPDVLEPMEQIRDFRSRYHLKQKKSHEVLGRSKRPSKHFHSAYQHTTDSSNVNQDINHLQHYPYDHQGATGGRYYSRFHGAEEEDDLVMIRSDDVITYSYRFGKSGEINRYPIDLAPQQSTHIRGSRSTLSNEMISKKMRRRKKRRQRMLQNVSPDELVTIDEMPYLTNYAIEDHIHVPQEAFGTVEQHRRGYFVGDTKIYDTNLDDLSKGNLYYGYQNNITNVLPSHFDPPRLYRNTLPRSHKPMRPPPNSQSNSPIYTGSSGTSPEAPAQFSSNQPHPSSPASPDSNITSQTTNVLIVNHCHVDRNEQYLPLTETERNCQTSYYNPNLVGIRGIRSSSSSSSLTQTTVHKRRSAMKMASSSNIDLYPRKTVQWLVDTKKRPEDISQDRKVVKYQVKEKLDRNDSCVHLKLE